MKTSRFEKYKKMEENIIKDVRNLFRLQKQIDDTALRTSRSR